MEREAWIIVKGDDLNASLNEFIEHFSVEYEKRVCQWESEKLDSRVECMKCNHEINAFVALKKSLEHVISSLFGLCSLFEMIILQPQKFAWGNSWLVSKPGIFIICWSRTTSSAAACWIAKILERMTCWRSFYRTSQMWNLIKRIRKSWTLRLELTKLNFYEEFFSLDGLLIEKLGVLSFLQASLSSLERVLSKLHLPSEVPCLAVHFR